MSTRTAGRVAVVDDEENIRETVGYALKREGYRVDLYPDGQAAWEKFTHGLPDVLVLDIVMPRMDGLELCRKIRGLPEVLPSILPTPPAPTQHTGGCHVNRLRKKFGRIDPEFDAIGTVYGLGYRYREG